MSKLIANVTVGGNWYGPAHGNADDVPADVTEQISNPACWDDQPKQRLTEAESKAMHPSSRPADVPESPPETSSVDEGTDVAEGDDEDQGATQYDRRAEELTRVPDDKDALLAFRDEHDLEADGRLGIENLRTALEEALRG